jgi:hypothetical protein
MNNKCLYYKIVKDLDILWIEYSPKLKIKDRVNAFDWEHKFSLNIQKINKTEYEKLQLEINEKNKKFFNL